MVSYPNKVSSQSQSIIDVMPYIFRPASVAVIGASRDNKKESAGGWVGRLINFGYKGKIYPINPNASEIMGLKAYPSVKDVPGPIDYTIINVPRHMAPQMLQEVVDKKVKAVHIYTAGFAEAGDEEGKKLQQEIEDIISGSQTRLIGPNCVGVYSPAGGLTFSLDVAKEAGEVSFITQTGTGGRRLVYLANARGLLFSKVVSFGNAADLGGEDFLEYFISDPETKVILMYIEGLKDGQRFFKLVREAVKVKPVIILAAGLTEGGAGAAASHTAALAGNQDVWQALFKQTGAMQVESFEEAIDQLVATLKLPPLKGNRVGLIGRGGGLGVVTTDMCERAGLKVPRFTPEVTAKLTEITPATAGSSVRNPVEIGIGRTGVSEHYARGIRLVASDPQVDFVLSFHNPEMYVFEFGVKDWVDDLSRETIAVARGLPKPLAVAFVPGSDPDVFKDIQQVQRQLLSGGVACFPTIEAAVRATSKLAAYYQFLGSQG